MTAIALLVSTRKGAWILRADSMRVTWDLPINESERLFHWPWMSIPDSRS